MQFSTFFTPREATKTLPLVRRIVEDILDAAARFRSLVQEKKLSDDSPEVEKMKQELHSYFEELRELGCEYKDFNFEVGLVDFPAIIDGEIVLLCWRSDEPSLRFYHGLEDGFAGRRPIPEHLLEDRDVPMETAESGTPKEKEA